MWPDVDYDTTTKIGRHDIRIGLLRKEGRATSIGRSGGNYDFIEKSGGGFYAFLKGIRQDQKFLLLAASEAAKVVFKENFNTMPYFHQESTDVIQFYLMDEPGWKVYPKVFLDRLIDKAKQFYDGYSNCSLCKKNIVDQLYWCEKCKRSYCLSCSPEVGIWIFRRKKCPSCQNKLNHYDANSI